VPICHACGKPGHVIRNCPTFTNKPGPSDSAFPAAFSAAVCVYPVCPLLHVHDNWSLFLVVDSGAIRHYSFIASDFVDINLRDDLGRVTGIDCPIHIVGSVPVVTVNSTGKPTLFTLVEVLYVPDLAQRSGGQYLRLLSV